MVTTTQVYNFLRSLFSAETYPIVSYDPNTVFRSVAGSAPIASLELNELSTGFTPSINKRRELQHPAQWSWLVIVAFNSEVEFTNLVNRLTETPSFQVSPDSGSTRIVVQRARYTHPPRQEPNTGSKAEFVLNVLVHPK